MSTVSRVFGDLGELADSVCDELERLATGPEAVTRAQDAATRLSERIQGAIAYAQGVSESDPDAAAYTLIFGTALAELGAGREGIEVVQALQKSLRDYASGDLDAEERAGLEGFLVLVANRAAQGRLGLLIGV